MSKKKEEITGTVFDFDNLQPGTIFYIGDDPKRGGVKLRTMPPNILEEINEATEKVVYKFHKRQRFPDVKINKKKRKELFWDYVIMELIDLKKPDGTLIESTAENKVKLAEGSTWFGGFLADKLEELNEIEAREAAEEEKN